MPTPSAVRFHGCLTALITPFTSDGEHVDLNAVARLVDRQALAGVSGVVFAGTTGESPTLEDSEWESLIAAGVEACGRHGVVPIAGTGSNSTKHAVELHTRAQRLGARASLSVNPYYNKPTQEGLYRHFISIADSCELPVIVYNIPGRTGGGLTLETLQRLSNHPNIRAIKDAAGSVDLAGETAASCPNLSVLSGDDALTLPMLSVGAVGVVSVASNVVPGQMSALVARALKGEFGEAREIHRDLSGLFKALFAETNPIPVKAALKLMRLDSGAVRLPMTPATVATVERLRVVLTKMELLRTPAQPAAEVA